jgi:hypothetical protein
MRGPALKQTQHAETAATLPRCPKRGSEGMHAFSRVRASTMASCVAGGLLISITS